MNKNKQIDCKRIELNIIVLTPICALRAAG